MPSVRIPNGIGTRDARNWVSNPSLGAMTWLSLRRQLKYLPMMDSPTQNSTQGVTAHAGHYHRFRMSKPVSQCHHITPTRSSDGSDAGDDRTRDDAGHCALGRPRWQLPDGAAFVHDASELGQAPMAADSSPSVGSRRCDLDGRR